MNIVPNFVFTYIPAMLNAELCRYSLLYSTILDIQENRTVTYLDLRSNDLTNSGLRGIVEHLRLNPVFHTVDVRSNSKISRDVVISMRRMFKSGGRPTAEIRWTDFGSPQEKRYIMSAPITYRIGYLKLKGNIR